MPDESSRLLLNHTNPGSSSSLRYDSIPRPPSRSNLLHHSNTTGTMTPGRPPLLSVPSTSSVRSWKSSTSLNDQVLDSYLKQSHTSTHHNNDSLSILNFELYNKLYSKEKKKSIFEDDDDDDDSGGFNLYAYLGYYIPILNWLPNYNFKESFLGDTLAGLSLASFQIPLVMSIATSLAHLSPTSGLYSMIISSIIYAIFGTVPILIVGPSPSTALIYGQAIELIKHESKFSDFSMLEISSCLTFCLSGILLGAGIFRLGYLDNVLSRALLKGFVAAIGLIMIINELSTELGLDKLSLNHPHVTTIDKILFIVNYYDQAHLLTLMISSITLIIVLSTRYIKDVLVNKYNYKKAIYIPELLLMVVIATYLSYDQNWNGKGVEILGDITPNKTKFQFQNPFEVSRLPIYKHLFTTSFLCTILGYFDSTTAVKALGAKYNYNVSSNRELIALGVINFVIGIFGGLPSFSALGRSKINLIAGATSPMSGLIMSGSSIIALFYLLSYLFYLPECVLALTTTIIGITVLQEVPSDLIFYWNIKGFDELATFSIIFLATLFWSAEAGVSFGVIIAIIRIIKNSSRSRIQILGRVPHTTAFRDADALIEESFTSFQKSSNDDLDEGEDIGRVSPPDDVDENNNNNNNINNNTDKFNNLIAEIEEIEGVLIIKIPEPLNFTNVGDLKSKLFRIEKYGSLLVHPSQPSIKDFKTIKSIIFDCKGMNELDSSATQILYEIIKKYIEIDKIQVCFTRVSTNIKCRKKLQKSGIVKLINDSFDYHHHNSHNRRNISHTELNNLSLNSSTLGKGFYLSIDEALKSIDLQSV
ncbi:putative sulfate transporter [Candida tropicalis]